MSDLTDIRNQIAQCKAVLAGIPRFGIGVGVDRIVAPQVFSRFGSLRIAKHQLDALRAVRAGLRSELAELEAEAKEVEELEQLDPADRQALEAFDGQADS